MEVDTEPVLFAEVPEVVPPAEVPFETLEERFASCEERLGYCFRDRAILELSLTHASVARTRLASNERLEFLGDSILGHLVCEALYHRFPGEAEGELTRIKSAIVSRTTCAAISYRMGLERFLLLGKGLSAHDRIPQSIMAAVFESLVAGLYLDGGMEAVRHVVTPLVEPEIEHAALAGNLRNYKSLLQQIAQKTYNETPSYRLLDEKGPDHSKCFKVAAVVGAKTFPAAWGPSKKESEQRAAQNALCEIEGLEVPHVAD
jgi:ribonuclease-3